MAYIRFAHLVVFLLAAFSLVPTKKVGATDCSGACSPFEMPPCRSSDCRCIPIGLVAGYCTYPSSPTVMKMVEEHPNLCQSHADCTKKESGSFCARYPNPDIEHGWCFSSNFEAYDVFFNVSSNRGLIKDFLPMFTLTLDS
ncbi:albumin-1 [Medicago truncatula]|uniref:Leginsulin/Albumin-1 n=2 Tax=Medicago truncatula TaxID=3880 RepID=G7L8E1_MEDTR|nr:albumin-1 [Medicago truncatula]AET01862.2 Leginsulin/Albumin-1 [Medicago truncatula]